jgi:ATP-dependent RNA helicase RhlE
MIRLTNDNTNLHGGFGSLGIEGRLLSATRAAGYDRPKPIQVKAIPPQLEGRDILGIAQTGSGKTAAFALPILSGLAKVQGRRKPRTARALVLAPTRELAVQIEETFRTLARGAPVTTALVLGGVSRGGQVRRLAQGVDVLVATPGRLIDLVGEGAVTLCEVRWLVLDEADRMLDMGFIHDVRRIAKATSPNRQTALFSATMPPEIAELARGLLKDPVRVEVAPQGTTAGEIDQRVIMARTPQKRQVLSDLLGAEEVRSVLVFARTKHGADRVARDLGRDGHTAAVIHGNKSQNARQRALNEFRDGSVRILVATDIAARGIDVPGISHVINFDLPAEAESYVHRIGRTGRNGADGVAITLCDPAERAGLRAIERLIRKQLPVMADHTGGADNGQAKAKVSPRRTDGRKVVPEGAAESRHHASANGARDESQPQRRRVRGRRRSRPGKAIARVA